MFVLRFYFHQTQIIPSFIEKDYWVIATLYFFANTFLFYIFKVISAGSFIVLSQHRIIWVVVMSMTILKKEFTKGQLIACLINLFGICMVLKGKSDNLINELSDNGIALSLVFIHGFISALASVYIEKTMKSNNTNIQVYCNQSLKLYLSGLPVYFIGALLLSNTDNTPLPPFDVIVPMTSLTVMQGITIGAIFKFHGAMIRTLIQSSSIVLIVLFSHSIVDTGEKLSESFWLWSCIVLFSLIMFKRGEIFEKWMIYFVLLVLVMYLIYNDSERQFLRGLT